MTKTSLQLSQQAEKGPNTGETPANTEADSISPRGGELNICALASKMETVYTGLGTDTVQN